MLPRPCPECGERERYAGFDLSPRLYVPLCPTCDGLGYIFDTVSAWHFLGEGSVLRDGETAPEDGRWLIHEGSIRICSSGLHASRRLLDALTYCPTNTLNPHAPMTFPVLCRVEVLRGEIVEDYDKLVGRSRRILWRLTELETKQVLERFIRKAALMVYSQILAIHPVVREYLVTGDEGRRIAAREAAERARLGAPAAASDAYEAVYLATGVDHPSWRAWMVGGLVTRALIFAEYTESATSSEQLPFYHKALPRIKDDLSAVLERLAIDIHEQREDKTMEEDCVSREEHAALLDEYHAMEEWKNRLLGALTGCYNIIDDSLEAILTDYGSHLLRKDYLRRILAEAEELLPCED